MSAIQDLAPHIDAFPSAIKDAKNASSHTNQSLADAAGLSLSTVSKFLSGARVDPKLYDAAALCRVLRLSLDALFGLDRPADDPAELNERVHSLELEDAHKDGELRELRAVNAALSERARMLRAVLMIMLCICAVMAAALIVYLLIDLSIREEGLVLWGSPTGLAWAAIALIGVSLVAVAVIVWRVLRK